MSIKLIVTDLDGTFLNSDHCTISRENIVAFKRAHELGIKLVIGSGRPKGFTDFLVEQLPFLDYLITSNGAVTYDINKGETIRSALISNSESLELFNIAESRNLPYEVHFDGLCCCSEESYNLFRKYHITAETDMKRVPDLKEHLNGGALEKLNILSISPKKRAELEKVIAEKCQVSFASSYIHPITKVSNLEISNVNATKGLAIKELADSLNIDKSDIMCFGDSENDSSMLSFAGYSFAMANGNSYAKKTAKYITDTNDNAGVAKAIKKYIFGE